MNFIKKYRSKAYASMAFVHDMLAVALVWLFAFLLRLNFNIPQDLYIQISKLIIYTSPIYALSFIGFGLYKGIWRFASIPDLKRIFIAVVVSAIALPALLFMLQFSFISVPRAVLIMHPVLLLAMMGGSRLAYRIWKEHRLNRHTFHVGKPVLVVGAGEAAIALLKALERSQESRVVGLLDDSASLQGRLLQGVKVLGRISDLPRLAQEFSASQVIIAMPSAKHQKRQQAVALANQASLEVFTVPAFDDLISGKVNVSELRHVEVEDLLGRDPVCLDDAGLHGLIEHGVVLVSGAGGSIGSELCRQIVRFSPRVLVCVDISEFSLYQLEQEFSQLFEQKIKFHYLTSDVKNAEKMGRILQHFQPRVVFHAAAYKHVPLMENENVAEAVVNNVMGTYTLAQAAKNAGVAKFVLISTDKAVNPTNVMGTTKRLAEMVCQGLQEEACTRFVIVRFGNVLGSSGSVIPKFREQIAQGGPITVTHPEITRYFMSISEAAQLVMQAGVMGKGGEIFVLDMGEPVRIVDLAKNMIHLSGFTEQDIKIEFTGLRPGEKLYEELLADDESTLPTTHEKLRIANARAADAIWLKSLMGWIANVAHKDELLIKSELKIWVPEYAATHQVERKNKQ